jgi:hypothetical protein
MTIIPVVIVVTIVMMNRFIMTFLEKIERENIELIQSEKNKINNQIIE